MINIQKTYQNQIATLFLVTTPIGDQEEISKRAITTLKKVDVIFCEDTKHSQKPLHNFDIKKKLLSFHKFNEKTRIPAVLKYLRSGANVALISCAGTPLIADPGYQLVVDVVNNGFNVTSVGINSPLLATLVCSTIPCQQFIFHNFLLPSRIQKHKQITQLLTNVQTVVCYESVHKIKKTLQIMQQLAPQRQFCLAREINKQHETFYRGSFKNLNFNDVIFKGEFTLVIAPYTETLVLDYQEFVDKMKQINLSSSQIIAIGKEFDYSKKKLYSILFNKEKKDESK